MQQKPKTAAAWIKENPEAKTSQLVALSGLNARTIQRAKQQAGTKNVVDTNSDKQTTESTTTSSFSQNGNSAEYSFKTGVFIRSLDDLVEACDIDLSIWVVERFICNKWEVGAKDKNNVIQVTPLFQVKVWLKPIVKQQTEILDIIREIVDGSKAIPFKYQNPTKLKAKKALKVTLSDIHIGLDPYIDGKSIFNYVYNERIFNENLNKVFKSIMNEYSIHGKFDVLIIDDLGDGLDGWNAMTTRGGHGLDQNMDNTKSFKVYIEGKLRFIEMIIKAGVANRIEVKSVSNCNHSGNFGFIANYAIGLVLGRIYDERMVKCYVMEKFMEHFVVGDHTFIVTHGKDAKYMFKGLPLDLNLAAIKFINDYIDHYKINTKYIHVEKGDLHQLGYKRIKKFDYRNFMSFAPPSVWQQHNFGDAYAGYSIQIIPFDTNEIHHTDYFFDLEIAN